MRPARALCYWVPSNMLGEGNWAILGLVGRSECKQEQKEPHSNQGMEEKLDV